MDAEAIARPDSLRQRLMTWWVILRICIEERLVYRGDFALGTFMRFLPIVTQIFLWGAVFSAVSGTTIRGYTANSMIAYYLLTMVVRAFSSMPGLSSGIAKQVRSGEIKKYLTQPIDMIGFLLFSRVAHKLIYYLVAAGPFAVVFFICRSYFPGWPPLEITFWFIFSTLMSFVLGFFIEATLGMIGFWFLEVSSLLLIYMLLNFFCSGHMFPLDVLPAPFDWIVKMSPFAFLAYFPAAVFLQQIQGPELYLGLAVEVGWTLFFIVLCHWAFRHGLRRYSAFGG